MMADRGLQFETLRAGDFHQRLASSNGLAVVMFSGPACGTCRSVASRLPEVAARAGISELFLVDVETCTAIAREFEIFHLPTLLLYKDGEFHAQIQSAVTTQAFSAAIDQALAHPAQEAP